MKDSMEFPEKTKNKVTINSVQFSRSVVSDPSKPHESQHARPPCPSPTPGVHSDSRPSSQWCHPAISSSVVPFSSCPQSLPAAEPFPMSQLFARGGQSTGVSAWASFLPKKSQGWSYDPAIPLLDINPEKTIIQKDAYTPMFTAALLTIANTWKQPKYPLTLEWIKKMWYTYTMEYYSAIKRMKLAATWMDLEIFILSEVSQTEKDKYHMMSYISGV